MKIENTTRGEIFWMDCNDERLVVVIDKNHRLYDSRVEMPIDDAMVSSISDPKVGIIEPVIVRNIGGKYEVVEGRQRVRAARKAQSMVKDRTIRVPLIVRSSVNDAVAASLSAIANNQRSEETPIQKGNRVKVLLETGHSKEEISSIFGVGWATISGWVKISEAPDELHRAIEDGSISASKAAVVARSKDKTKALQKAKEAPPESILFRAVKNGAKWEIKCSKNLTELEHAMIGECFQKWFGR
jgi:ParB family chromosome partitioning protein